MIYFSCFSLILLLSALEQSSSGGPIISRVTKMLTKKTTYLDEVAAKATAATAEMALV